MNLDTLKIINQRLKPVERKIRQVLQIGKITKVNESEFVSLSISFSEREEIHDVPYLSINALQVSPKLEDFALVYSPEGRLEQGVALALVSLAKKMPDGVTLSNGGSTLGKVLSDLSDAIQAITTTGFFTAPSGGGPVTGTSKVVDTKGFN